MKSQKQTWKFTEEELNIILKSMEFTNGHDFNKFSDEEKEIFLDIFKRISTAVKPK